MYIPSKVPFQIVSNCIRYTDDSNTDDKYACLVYNIKTDKFCVALFHSKHMSEISSLNDKHGVLSRTYEFLDEKRLLKSNVYKRKIGEDVFDKIDEKMQELVDGIPIYTKYRLDHIMQKLVFAAENIVKNESIQKDVVKNEDKAVFREWGKKSDAVQSEIKKKMLVDISKYLDFTEDMHDADNTLFRKEYVFKDLMSIFFKRMEEVRKDPSISAGSNILTYLEKTASELKSYTDFLYDNYKEADFPITKEIRLKNLVEKVDLFMHASLPSSKPSSLNSETTPAPIVKHELSELNQENVNPVLKIRYLNKIYNISEMQSEADYNLLRILDFKYTFKDRRYTIALVRNNKNRLDIVLIDSDKLNKSLVDVKDTRGIWDYVISDMAYGYDHYNIIENDFHNRNFYNLNEHARTVINNTISNLKDKYSDYDMLYSLARMREVWSEIPLAHFDNVPGLDSVLDMLAPLTYGLNTDVENYAVGVINSKLKNMEGALAHVDIFIAQHEKDWGASCEAESKRITEIFNQSDTFTIKPPKHYNNQVWCAEIELVSHVYVSPISESKIDSRCIVKVQGQYNVLRGDNEILSHLERIAGGNGFQTPVLANDKFFNLRITVSENLMDVGFTIPDAKTTIVPVLASADEVEKKLNEVANQLNEKELKEKTALENEDNEPINDHGFIRNEVMNGNTKIYANIVSPIYRVGNGKKPAHVCLADVGGFFRVYQLGSHSGVVMNLPNLKPGEVYTHKVLAYGSEVEMIVSIAHYSVSPGIVSTELEFGGGLIELDSTHDLLTVLKRLEKFRDGYNTTVSQNQSMKLVSPVHDTSKSVVKECMKTAILRSGNDQFYNAFIAVLEQTHPQYKELFKQNVVKGSLFMGFRLILEQVMNSINVENENVDALLYQMHVQGIKEVTIGGIGLLEHFSVAAADFVKLFFDAGPVLVEEKAIDSQRQPAVV